MKTLFALCISTMLFLIGCNTPEARIKREPALFASLSSADQQLIREGKVALGFTPEMVKLAVGEPDRIYTRTDTSGTSESWSYTTYESSGGLFLYRGYYHRDFCHGSSLYPYYLGYTGDSRRERETYKVVFSSGRVAAIEQNKR